MSRALSLLALLAAVAAIPSHLELDNYSFDKFVVDFNMQYSASEMPARKALFDAELARVRSHNAKNLSWKEGVTKFTAMTPAEKNAFFGRSKGVHKSYRAQANKNKNLKALPADFVLKPVSSLPKQVDWRKESTNIVSAVKDQGHCGSCWAFASTAVIESHVAKASGLLFDLSVQQIAMCSPNPNHCGGTGGCSGATCELAFDYLSNSKGLYQEYQYSYASYYGVDQACSIPTGSPVAAIDGYVRLPENNYTALMNAIATVGPIGISVDASAWSSYAGGIFDGCNQVNPDIDHAVVLVGYGEEAGKKYWIVRNSWSPKWGEEGYIRIARTDDEEGRCGSDITPQNGNACEGETDPQKVCGTCGILFDTSYPLNAKAL
jgi:cathepsin L